LSELSLTARVRTGVFWTAASTLLIQGMSLARSIVLARLLTRDDFGLFGMALTILGALGVLTDLNLSAAVIAGKSEEEEKLHTRLNTVWTAELGRRLLLSLLLLASAYPAVRFYQEPRLFSILLVVSLMPVVDGFQNIGLVLLKRRVRFTRVVWFDLSAAFVNTAITILLAFWTRNVWALVLGQLLSTVGTALLSYLFYPYRPRFAFDRSAFRQSFLFGKYIFIIGVMTYLTTNADNIVVGKLRGTSVLGTYLVAYSLASLPVNVLVNTLTKVMFPAYAELGRDRRDRLDSAVLRAFSLTSALLILVTVPVGLLSNEIVQLFYGPRWAAAGQLVRILILMGLFRGLTQMISPLIIGLSRPELDARAKVIEAVLFVAMLYPLTARYGAAGAAWAGVLIYFLTFMVRLWFCKGLVPETFRKVPGLLLSAALAGIGGAAAGGLVLSVAASPMARLLLGSSVTMVSSLFLLLLTNGRLRREATEVMGGTWKRVR